MGFSFPFFKKKVDNVSYFGLYFTESHIAGFVFQIIAGRPRLVAEEAVTVHHGLDSMLEDIDRVISGLELKTHLSLDKTIFFLHSTMLDETTHDIKEPFKAALKKISRELELEPLGYIDLHDGVERNLKESSIVNALVVEVSSNQIAIFVYKGGILTGSATSSRTDSIPDDLNALLETFPKKVILPTKLILYGTGDLNTIASEISTYNWSNKVFTQHPTIDILKDTKLNLIMISTFANELLSQEGETAVVSETESGYVPPPVSSQTREPLGKFGFTIGSDVRTHTQVQESPYEDEPVYDEAIVTKNSPNMIMKRIQSRIPVFLSFIKHPNISMAKGKNLKLPLIAVATVFVLVAIGFLYEYFVHKATVKLVVATESIKEDLELTIPISEKATTQALALVKHIKVSEYTNEKLATGKRDIGEKAKGEIIIHNFDNNEKTIPKSTQLTYKSLTFILDTEVTVASSSGISADGVKQSGKKKVAVTAGEIGPEYNIAKGSQMAIAGLADSLYVGIVDTNLTGGTKKQVTTVSKGDLESLKQSIEDEVTEKAKTDLTKAITSDELLIEDLTKIEVSNTDYSKEVGEESKNISIKASAETIYYTISKKHLEKRVVDELTKSKKASYTIAAQGITQKIDTVEIADDEEEAVVTIQAEAKQYKQIDDMVIKSKLTKKPISALESAVSSEGAFIKVELVSSTPNLGILSSWLPFFVKNITIVTATK